MTPQQGDADKQRIAILGYGAEARAQALRLRQIGHDVAVAVRPGGTSWVRAVRDGFRPVSAGEAVADADVVALHVPQAEQPSLYANDVAPRMKPGGLLVFAHGGAVLSGALVPAPDVDVVLVAMCLRADALRCRFAVDQDATGQAAGRAVAFARAAYAEAAASIETTTFTAETEAELTEQAQSSGGFDELMAAWERVLTSPSHEPDEARLAYFDRLKRLVSDLHAPRIPSPPGSTLDVREVVNGVRRGAA